MVDESAGWIIDPDTLGPVVTDRRGVEASLAGADPVERLFLLPLLGQLDRAMSEADRLLADPQVRQDPWQVLLLVGELHRASADPEQAERVQTEAWRFARSRSRQATTLHHIGQRCWEFGDSYAAGACFELALTMRRGFAEPDVIAASELAVGRVRQVLGFDAIVLAGGQGRRFGGGRHRLDKPGLPLAGWPLVDHVLLATSGATSRIVVGPPRIALGSPVFCREQPPGGGPVAAIAAAAGSVRRPVVAVLAADLPFVGGALAALRQCLDGATHDVGVLVDTAGRVNYLASMWRTSSLLAALDRLSEPAGAPVKALFQGMRVAHVPDFDALGADCDTPEDLRAAQERIRRRSPGRLPAAQLAWPRLELHSPS